MRFKEFLRESTGKPPIFEVQLETYETVETTYALDELLKNIKDLCRAEDIIINFLDIRNRSNYSMIFFVELYGHYGLKELNDLRDKVCDLVSKFMKFPYVISKHAINGGLKTPEPSIMISDNIPEGTTIHTSKLSMNFTNSNNVSLKDIHKRLSLEEGTIVRLYGSENVKSNVLGLLLIKGFEGFDIPNHQYFVFQKWLEILVDHINGDRDVLDCQEELIQAGLKEYARL